MNNYNTKSHQQQTTVREELRWVPNATEISTETLVNLLVSKGITTAEELVKMEEKIRNENVYQKNSNFINIKNDGHHHQSSGFKNFMSKRRLTRRIGTLFFGWKWKKTKKNF